MNHKNIKSPRCLLDKGPLHLWCPLKIVKIRAILRLHPLMSKMYQNVGPVMTPPLPYCLFIIHIFCVRTSFPRPQPCPIWAEIFHLPSPSPSTLRVDLINVWSLRLINEAIIPNSLLLFQRISFKNALWQNHKCGVQREKVLICLEQWNFNYLKIDII